MDDVFASPSPKTRAFELAREAKERVKAEKALQAALA